MPEYARARVAFGESEFLRQCARDFDVPPVTGFPGAIHVPEQQATRFFVFAPRVLRWYFDVRGILRICLGAEVCPLDVYEAYLRPSVALRVSDVHRSAWQVCGREAQDGP